MLCSPPETTARIVDWTRFILPVKKEPSEPPPRSLQSWPRVWDSLLKAVKVEPKVTSMGHDDFRRIENWRDEIVM